jgi:tetratricopeptide (TPR) repeat protein
MTHLRTAKLLVAVSALALLTGPSWAADAEPHAVHAPTGAQVGEVNFPTSCSPDVQRRFNQAVWTLHSFWYEEALKAFTAITEVEPNCAMGYWGMAMSQWYPLWYPPTPAMLTSGAAAVAKGLAVPPATERGRAYLEAIGRFYQDSDTLDHRTRALAYTRAMEQLYERYPDDREAGVFYALALNATWPPTDKSYANLRKAAAILERVSAEQPNHPGVVHYLIHSYDVPAFAPEGLAAARRYGAIAPAVPHAQHMPSHIFTRLGFWQEAIASNRAAHEAARAYAERTIGPSAWDQETLHTLDYLAYAHLQMAQDRAAKRVVDDLATFRQGPASLPAAYAAAAIPSRYALERRSWHEAARLSSPGIPFPLERFPWAEAMLAFTRALGAAHTGDLVTAQAEIARLGALKEKLTQAKNTYWANLVEAQRLGAAAVASRTRGEGEEAVELARAAADLEDSMDKHPATPAAVLPARELYADLLLELGDPSEALGEYARSLETNPHRFRSLLGIARSSKQSGDSSRARDAYQELLELSGEADTERPELMEARAFLTN